MAERFPAESNAPRSFVVAQSTGMNALGFMFAPVRKTLIAGVQALGGARWHVSESLIPMKGGESITLRRQHIAEAVLPSLRKGDIFCWLGLHASREAPWQALKQLRVWRVYFQTEPWTYGSGSCAELQWLQSTDAVDEVWFYSRSNMRHCTALLWQNGTKPPYMRFVPPGAVASNMKSNDSTTSIHGHDAPDSGALRRWTFFGDLHSSTAIRRRRCVDSLHREAHLMDASLPTVQPVYKLWSESAVCALMHRSAFFLNLHKTCNSSSPPATVKPVEAFRMALLLDSAARCGSGEHGASSTPPVLILSETSDPQDEEDWEGIVSFAPIAELPSAYARLTQMDSARKNRLAQEQGAQFRLRFAPASILRRAQVDELLISRE